MSDTLENPANGHEAKGAGVTFDWLFFDNSKLIDFDDKNVLFLRNFFIL
jgi:hypothetical protein